jgi:methionyl-tRNA synthetase
LNLINGLKILTYPFLPFSAERLHRMLGYQDDIIAHGWRLERLTPGAPLGEPAHLFTKLEAEAAEARSS